jgi:serine/threonine-protein kinase
MHGDASDQPGATGRGYRIERLIGTGGAAAVYEARRLGPNGPGEPMIRVACKVMHAQRRDAPGFRRLVWHEAVLGLRMTAGHPNLVEVLDFFDDAQEQLCIVMELVDGASVAELREPEQRQPFPIVRRIAGEVLEALVHLHGRGVLHRDLSLRNVLVSAGGAVKVTDFGIARVMEQGQVHTANIRGTPMYLSSEALNLLPLDVRADLFSLGAVLYDLVAGTPPCGNQDMLGTMFARNAAGLFDPLPRDTPADLAELITGLIQKDRDARRPQTAAEALALLRGCDQPVASQEELAALVEPAKSRRDQELADHRPANVLPPGHVLALRDDRGPSERAAGEPSGRVAKALPARVAESAVDVLPARVADPRANPLPDLVAYFGVDMMARLIADLPANSPPDLVIELESDGAPDFAAARAGDAVPEHIDDALPDALADRAPAPVADLAADAQPDRVIDDASGGTLHRRLRTTGRFVARRVVLTVAIGACALVLGFLVDDGNRGDRTASEVPPRPEAPAFTATPAPMPLAGPESVMPEEPEALSDAGKIVEPHRARKRVDTLRPRREDVRRPNGRPGPVWMRRQLAPITSVPPVWGTP